MSTTFLKKYKVLGKVGEGSFSEVLKCQDRETGVLYAAKRLKKVKETITEVLQTPEVVAMRNLKEHPNILHMIESHCDPLPGKVTLIFELMDMSMYDLIRTRKRCLPERRVKNYVYQILKGLDHLHRYGLFHRDVKPENILLKNDLVKLADLGSVRGIFCRPPYTEYISTRWYRSPECLLTTGFYGPKMDIWAAGCVYYELLTLKPLFPGANEVDQLTKIHNILGTPNQRLITKFRRQKSRNYQYFFPSQTGSGMSMLLPNASEAGRDVLKHMLEYDPETRSSVRRLLEHRYFSDLREADMIHPRKRSCSLPTGSNLQASSERCNPVLLSYMTSCEKRRKTKHTKAKQHQKSDKPMARVVATSPSGQRKARDALPRINRKVTVRQKPPERTWNATMQDASPSKLRDETLQGKQLHLPRLKHMGESGPVLKKCPVMNGLNMTAKPTVEPLPQLGTKRTSDVTRVVVANLLPPSSLHLPPIIKTSDPGTHKKQRVVCSSLISQSFPRYIGLPTIRERPLPPL